MEPPTRGRTRRSNFWSRPRPGGAATGCSRPATWRTWPPSIGPARRDTGELVRRLGNVGAGDRRRAPGTSLHQRRNPEWRFVTEGPAWRGRRAPRW